jgi:membrane carboxypeptidase/penicillin-binding protein PbpC
MTKLMQVFAVVFPVALLLAFGYGAYGYLDALGDAEDLAARADGLIARGYDAPGLGPGRMDQLLKVQDPGFFTHSGIDLSTPGAGLTTMTQSLAKRVGFEKFEPGIGKLRQTGYAMGLERRLSKSQIFALFLDTVEMGPGPEGWMTGFFGASRTIYRRPVVELDDRAFMALVAVMIAPGNYDLSDRNGELGIRIDRIERLVAGNCKPHGVRDVWLEGCR